MKNYILVFTFLVVSVSSYAQDLETYFSKADAFFKSNVSNGKVAYSKIHKNPEQLNTLLKIAGGISVSKDDVNNYQAFWINTYNLLVIKGLIDNYPSKSPLDDSGFFDKTLYAVGGIETTLNDIEHKLLRGNFKEPRFHFVLVCGAVGLPTINFSSISTKFFRCPNANTNGKRYKWKFYSGECKKETCTGITNHGVV